MRDRKRDGNDDESSHCCEHPRRSPLQHGPRLNWMSRIFAHFEGDTQITSNHQVGNYWLFLNILGGRECTPVCKKKKREKKKIFFKMIEHQNCVFDVSIIGRKCKLFINLSDLLIFSGNVFAQKSKQILVFNFLCCSYISTNNTKFAFFVQFLSK